MNSYPPNPGILGTNLSGILIKLQTVSFTKMHLKISSKKWRPFCSGQNELTHWGRVAHVCHGLSHDCHMIYRLSLLDKRPSDMRRGDFTFYWVGIIIMYGVLCRKDERPLLWKRHWRHIMSASKTALLNDASEEGYLGWAKIVTEQR